MVDGRTTSGKGTWRAAGGGSITLNDLAEAGETGRRVVLAREQNKTFRGSDHRSPPRAQSEYAVKARGTMRERNGGVYYSPESKTGTWSTENKAPITMEKRQKTRETKSKRDRERYDTCRGEKRDRGEKRSCDDETCRGGGQRARARRK